MSKCRICSQVRELRLGFCFDCAEAQSIIGTGFDMYEKGDGGTELKAKEATDRLKLLIQHGWRT